MELNVQCFEYLLENQKRYTFGQRYELRERHTVAVFVGAVFYNLE